MDEFVNDQCSKINYDDYQDTVEDEAIRIKTILEQHANIAHMGGIVVSSKDRPIIGTTALDTCFGIILYDRKNKKGIVGHADNSGKIAILNSMIKLLEKNEKQVIEYGIVSGYRTQERKDYSGVTELLTYLETHCPPNIELVPFQNLGVQECSNMLAYEFAFDVNTGQDVASYLFYDRGKSSKKYWRIPIDETLNKTNTKI